LILLRVIQL